jgi:D-glycero-D-manno-heptose 1,7-bisphosphate phosphatase
MKQAVFLDRDGVLNEAVVRSGKPYPPATVAELRIFSDAPSSLQRLRQAGFLLIVVTNQPDIARGTVGRPAVEAINQSLRRQLPLDEIYVCEHDDRHDCSCRKPKPGLLLRAAGEHGIDLKSSFLVGDRWRDIEAGFAAGCQTVWIDREYDDRAPGHGPNARVASLSDAVTWIIHQYTSNTRGVFLSNAAL